VGFLVNFLLHKTKIPTVDMKVWVCSKFRKNFFWKKVKSPLSMNFGRITTSKCRGMLQKMGYCTPNLPPRSPGPCNMQGHKYFIKKESKNYKKKNLCTIYPGGSP
jgi:hypothetical protein